MVPVLLSFYPMATHDIVGGHLKEDFRIQGEVLARKKVFDTDLYSIELCIYPGLKNDPVRHQDLMTVVYKFKQESIRIMLKQVELKPGLDPEAEFKKMVGKWSAEEKSPVMLIRDAKRWADLPFTQADMDAFTEAGLEHHQKK
ncbi:MAG: hypothetical protein JNL01_04185 [Bdellovibrionales bacterium]|nr:hypothetical protein [Bdellovibrionales bacterium]